MRFSEWLGFVVKSVAMTFQIMKKTVAEPVVFVSRGRIPDSIILVPVEVGLILRLDKCT